jgi:hypothetical protein
MMGIDGLIDILVDLRSLGRTGDPTARAELVTRAKAMVEWLAAHDDMALGALVDQAASFFARPPSTPS